MKFNIDGISFVPVGSGLFYKGTLLNLSYNEAVLNITVKGNGDKIRSFKINGEESEPFVRATTKGICNIEILLS